MLCVPALVLRFLEVTCRAQPILSVEVLSLQENIYFLTSRLIREVFANILDVLGNEHD